MNTDLRKVIQLIYDKYEEYLIRPINFTNADLYLIIQNINPKYRLYLFKEICSQLSKEDYCFGLKTAYIKTEGLNDKDTKITLDEILDLFKKSDLKMLMGEDYEKFCDFPDVLTIYRGTSKGNSSKAISWTIDKDRAIWFYKKYNSNGTVLEAQIKKEDVVCYLDKTACNENEVIINYKKIFNVKELPKLEVDKELDLEKFNTGNINMDYVMEASQWFLQKLANIGILPTMELATEVFKSYQTQGIYKSNYILNFPSGEKIKLYELLEKMNSKSN